MCFGYACIQTKMLKPQLFFKYLLPFRYYSVNADPQNVVENCKHPFKQLLSKNGVINHFLQNIIYQDDNILVLNKPAGLGKSPPTRQLEKGYPIPQVHMDHIMEDLGTLMPKFKEKLIVKFPERYSSGVLIIAGSDAAKEKVEKCKRRAKGNDECLDSYLVVSQSKPVINTFNGKFAIKLAQNSTNTRKVPVLTDTWSQHDMKKQRVKLFRVKHKLVSEGPLASLVQVSVSTNSSNALRLYFATKLLSPLLGDNIFSGRVKDILGVPLLLDPWSDVANSPKRLPVELLRALSLSSNETSLVPLCVHLNEVSLPGYHKGKDFILRAPIPNTFNWVCHKLGLSIS